MCKRKSLIADGRVVVADERIVVADERIVCESWKEKFVSGGTDVEKAIESA